MNSKVINNLTYLLGYWKNGWIISQYKFHLSHLGVKEPRIIGQHLSSNWFGYNFKIKGGHTFILLGVSPNVTGEKMQQALNRGDDNLVSTIEYFIIRGDEMQKYIGDKYLQLNGRVNSNNTLNFSITPQRDTSRISLTLPNFILQTSTSC